MKNIIFVGPDPQKINESSNPGGQLTAAIGLVHYFSAKGIVITIVDTLQSSFPTPSFATRLALGLKRVSKLVLLLQTKNYSGVILFSGAGFSFYERTILCGLCRMFSVQSILMIRDGNFMKMLISNPFKTLIMRFFLKFPCYIVVQGKTWEDLLVSHKIPINKIRIIRNWLSFDQEVSNTSIKKTHSLRITFTFIGWIVKEKGLHELMGAIKNLQAHGYSFYINIIGGGNLLEKLTMDTINSHVDGFVNFTGWLRKSEIEKYLDSTQVLVLPSYAEGFPNVILEAMCRGIPVISTNVGAIPDTISNNVNGFLIEPMNEKELELAMESYINSPELVELHSIEVLKTISKKHGFENNLNVLLKLLSK